MPTTEIQLIQAASVTCTACGEIAPPQYDDDELDYELGWHVVREHCTCGLLCADCFDDSREDCDAYIYDNAA